MYIIQWVLNHVVLLDFEKKNDSNMPNSGYFRLHKISRMNRRNLTIRFLLQIRTKSDINKVIKKNDINNHIVLLPSLMTYIKL